MIYKLHYVFLTAGANALGILLGVFMEYYTDATSTEIGLLYMMMPFIGILCRPLICSHADRKQSHRKYLMVCQAIVAISYSPFIIIPLMGPQVYDVHPRLCFYILVTLKVLGDAAFGGIVSIGDSLAINYAKRINNDYSVYRVWGTISWMVFGFVTGQINEIWFLPKYVPAFMILILSALLGMFVVYLWPEEYFVMVTHPEKSASEPEKQSKTVVNENGEKIKAKKENAMTKSLMPREVVWAHAKKKLFQLVTLRCCSNNNYNDEPSNGDDRQYVSEKSSSRTKEEINIHEKSSKAQNDEISTKIQGRILILLFRRDLRVIFYLFLFIGAGFTVVPLSFFFMSLSEICHQENRCDFSQLVGTIQVSMSIFETFLFFYIKRIMDKIGRLNTFAYAFLLVSLKYAFYGTVWFDVHPYYSILAETVHGLSFGTFLTLMIEMGHTFANEVEHLIPELIDREIISPDANREKLKLSLQATMQAIISTANDGLGRGFGALIYGLVVDHYGYQILWQSIAVGAGTMVILVLSANIVSAIFGIKMGITPVGTKEHRESSIHEDCLAVMPREALTKRLSTTI